MKIIYFYQHFVLPEKSGITRTYEFARRLSSFGHEVHLVVSDESLSEIKTRPYVTEREGMFIHWLPIPYHNQMKFHRRLWAFFNYILGALKTARSISCDVIYVSSPPLTSIVPAVVTSKLKKVPLVLEVRDLWPDLPILFGALRNPFTIGLAKWLEKIAYTHATHVVALSPGIQRAVVSRGVSLTNSTVIPNSCDIDLFKTTPGNSILLPQQISDRDSIVLYPGTIGIANGLSYVVKLAAETLKINPSIKFLIVGEGKDKKQTIELARNLKVLDVNLFFLNPLSKKEIPLLYKRANLIINTLVNQRPLWNSSPNKFFDALAVGKPIAINFRGWLAELIESHECGLVLDPIDIRHSAIQLSKALSLPLWTEGCGRRAFQLGVEKFERNQLSLKLNEILLKVTQSDRSNQAAFRKVSR